MELNPMKKVSNSALSKLANMLPEELITKELNKQWFKNTKFMDDLPETKNKLKKVMTPGTKKIKYKNKQAHTWLKELQKTDKLTKEQEKFITWFQIDYPLLSLKQMKK
jgi:hypothetical protein